MTDREIVELLNKKLRKHNLEFIIVDDQHVYFCLDAKHHFSMMSAIPRSLKTALYGTDPTPDGEHVVYGESYFEEAVIQHRLIKRNESRKRKPGEPIVVFAMRDALEDAPWLEQLIGCKSAEELALKLSVIED